MNIHKKIRRAVERKIARQDWKRARRTTAKPGRVYHFDKFTGEYLGSSPRVAKFLPSSPVINGVRMRYELGRLVPRVRK